VRLKDWLRRHIPPSMYERMVAPARPVRVWWYRNDLTRLALLFNTDKVGSHWYTQHYQHYFDGLKEKPLNLLEIGVGGYEDGEVGGESLRMWKAYFRKSRIVGIDICDKRRFCEDRIDIRQCDQTDCERLTDLSKEYGGFDIIIDDGSHISEHVVKTFQTMFPHLRPNGIYAVEDTQTSYWSTWGGGIGNPGNAMEYFKGLVDGINYVEYPIANYTPSYFDENIVGIAFFHNLILIFKGSNAEKTNAPHLIQREIETARLAQAS
jgi:hypothetical protein